MGYAREFEDGMATSLSSGVFGDVAAFVARWQHKDRRMLLVIWYFLSVSTLDTSCVTVLKRDVFTPALPLGGRGSLHPHILVVLLGHDLGSRVGQILRGLRQAALVAELQRWSRRVLAAAQRMKFDLQMAFADTLDPGRSARGLASVGISALTSRRLCKAKMAP